MYSSLARWTKYVNMSRLLSVNKLDLNGDIPSKFLPIPCKRKELNISLRILENQNSFPSRQRSAFSSRWNNSWYKWIVITLGEPHPPYLGLVSDTNLTPVPLTAYSLHCRIIPPSHFSLTFALSWHLIDWFFFWSDGIFEIWTNWDLIVGIKGKYESLGLGDDRLATLLADSNRFGFYRKWQLFFSSKQTWRERFDITFIFNKKGKTKKKINAHLTTYIKW